MDNTFAGPLVRVVFGALLACVPFGLLGQATSAVNTHRKTVVSVPFVGCRSDGQLGPQEAPSGKGKAVPIAAEAAEKLAYYKAEQGYGVLAPRGWYCFGTYGSNGEVLYVSPNPIRGVDALATTKWKGFTGPAIEASFRYGDTSRRFDVARMIARVFPDRRAFARTVIEEGIEPASAFPFGPYPKDKLTYRSKELVEYETPARTQGLGTQSWLLKNGDTIRGVAILVGQTPNLAYLAVRVSREMSDLAPDIIRQAEQEAAKAPEE